MTPQEAAIALSEQIIAHAPYPPGVQLWIDAMQPFICRALAGETFDAELLPNPYDFQDEGTDALPSSFGNAEAEFSYSLLTPSEKKEAEEQEAYIESLRKD